MEAPQRQALNQAMARLARGERGAAEPVFQLLWPPLKAFAARWLAGSAQAEDVAQQVLVRLFAQASAYRPDQDALAWALEVAVWECRSERRRLQRRREEVLSAAEAARPSPAPGPAAEAEAHELEQALGEALAGLSEADRRALAAALADEAAGGATARKRKQRALERLRALWRRAHGE